MDAYLNSYLKAQVNNHMQTRGYNDEALLRYVEVYQLVRIADTLETMAKRGPGIFEAVDDNRVSD